MKLLIAYDGSRCADAALDDLIHAGLPREGEALVVNVVEVWLPPPPPSVFEIVEMASSSRAPIGLERRYMAAAEAIVAADKVAATAAERLQSIFPRWSVKHEAASGSPTWELFSKAEEFEADLVLVGSHGRTAVSRFFLGSISQWLLNEAPCSVRVARGRLDEPDFPLRIVVGIDGSRNAEFALEEVMTRTWPDKTEIRVVRVDQPLQPTPLGGLVPTVLTAVEDSNAEENEQSQQEVANAVELLRAKGLRAEGVVKVGDPKRVLVEFAEEWRADCIFLGATGLSNRLERFLLGSVAGAVAARAQCSVEIVRAKRRSPKTNGNGN